MSKSKATAAQVTTFDIRLNFDVFPNTTGQELFDQTAETIGLKEKRLFGLQYLDKNGHRAWLRLSETVLSHDLTSENPLQLKFRVKHFPEDVEAEVIQSVTKRLLFLQVREAVLNDEIYCPPDIAVQLASYACQAKHGKRVIRALSAELLSCERLLPDRILKQHGVSPVQWASRIELLWSEHGSMLREDAYVKYLKVAQHLEMYGRTYFDVNSLEFNTVKRHGSGTAMLLGINSRGINVYYPTNKLTPTIGFKWTDFNTFNQNKKKFSVGNTFSVKPAPFLSVTTSHERIAKQIADLSIENYQMYFTRRQPEPEEYKELRKQASTSRGRVEEA